MLRESDSASISLHYNVQPTLQYQSCQSPRSPLGNVGVIELITIFWIMTEVNAALASDIFRLLKIDLK